MWGALLTATSAEKFSYLYRFSRWLKAVHDMMIKHDMVVNVLHT